MKALLLKSALAFTLLLMLTVLGCDNETDSPGFGVRTWVETTPNSFLPYSPNLVGEWRGDYFAAEPFEGSLTWFQRFNGGSSFYVQQGRCPATWSITVDEVPSFTNCGGQTARGIMHPRKYADFYCSFSRFRSSMFATPSALEPETNNYVTITGQGISNAYGMPRVYVYAADGTVIGMGEATAYGPGNEEANSWMSAQVYLPPVESANYTFMASNATETGDYTHIGGGYFFVKKKCSPAAEEHCYRVDGKWNPVTCTCTRPNPK